MKAKRINLYIKTTEKCNLNCTHCYNMVEDVDSDLDPESIKSFLVGMSQYYSKSDSDIYLSCIFHGGEPTLVDVSRLNTYVEIIKSALSYMKIKFCIQTNLVLLNDDIIKFVKNNCNNNIGISYSPGLRFQGDDQKYEKLWVDNMVKLKDNGIIISAVVNLSPAYIKDNTPRMFLEQFIFKYGIKGFHFEVTTFNGNASTNWDKTYIPADEYDRWKTSLTKIIIEEKIYKNIVIEDIIGKAKSFYDGVYVGCSTRSCMENTITINANGTLGNCPNISKTNVISNINQPFENYMDSNTRKDLIVKERIHRYSCLACEWFQVCNGGCVHVPECFEGKEFFATLKYYLDNDKEFNDYVQEWKRQ